MGQYDGDYRSKVLTAINSRAILKKRWKCIQIGCVSTGSVHSKKETKMSCGTNSSPSNFGDFSDFGKGVLNSAFSSTDAEDALRKIAKLLDGQAIVHSEAVEFSPSTGKPVKFETRPFRAWDGRLWLNYRYNAPSLGGDEALFRPLLDFLPEGKTKIVEVGDRKFIVRHVPEKSEGCMQCGGTTPNYIEFTKTD